MDFGTEGLKGGVLIIGSLLWQDSSTDVPGDNLRKRWRTEHLDMNHKVAVKVPIRYGRYSRPVIPVTISVRPPKSDEQRDIDQVIKRLLEALAKGDNNPETRSRLEQYQCKALSIKDALNPEFSRHEGIAINVTNFSMGTNQASGSGDAEVDGLWNRAMRYIGLKAPASDGQHRLSKPLSDNSTLLTASLKKGKKKNNEKFLPALYTMVFSREYDTPEKRGTAYLSPLKARVKGFQELVAQVYYLSKAEGIYDPNASDCFFSKPWGAIAISVRDDCPYKREILALWAGETRERQRLEEQRQGEKPWVESGYVPFHERFCMNGELSCLNEDGSLAILPIREVPTLNDSIGKRVFEDLGYDFILTAVTMPKNEDLQNNRSGYPLVEKVGELAQLDERKYFKNNYVSNITTCDDKRILERLGVEESTKNRTLEGWHKELESRRLQNGNG